MKTIPHKIATLVLFLLLPLYGAVENGNVLNMTFVTQWAKDQPEIAASLDSLVRQLQASLSDQKDVRITANDSLENMDVQALYGDAYDPLRLFKISGSQPPDLIVVFTDSPQDSGIAVSFRAIDFYTGNELTQSSVVVMSATANDDARILQAAFEPFLKTLRGRLTPFGFPFPRDQFGAVVVADASADSALTQIVQSLANAYKQGVPADQAFRCRILNIERIAAGSAGNFCHLGEKISRLLNARLVTLAGADGSARSPLALPITNLDKPAVNIELPIQPTLDLFCLQINWDSGDARAVTSALAGCQQFDPQINEANEQSDMDTTVLLFTHLVTAHAKWKEDIEPGSDTQDSVLTASIHSSYHALEKMVPDSSLLKGWIHLNHADFEFLSGECDTALLLLASAESLFVDRNDSLALLFTQLESGKVYNFHQDYEKAQNSFARALVIAQERSDSLSQAQIENNLAMLAEMQGNPDQAFEYYQQSASLFNAIGDPYKTCQIYGHLTRLLRNNNQLDESHTYGQGYLRMAKELRSEPAISRAYFQLGLTLLSQQDLDGAIANFNSAADYMEILGDTVGLARVDINLGAIYAQKSDYENARLRYESALKMSQAVGDKANIITSYINLGDLAVTQKKWDEAQNYYDNAEKTARELDDNRELAVVTYAKGLAHLKEGRLKTGYGELKRAIEIGGGTVHGDVEQEQAFMRKLEKIIGEIQDIHNEVKARSMQ